MDRELVACVLLALLAATLAASFMLAYHNMPSRKYKRRLKRNYAQRREHQSKLRSE